MSDIDEVIAELAAEVMAEHPADMADTAVQATTRVPADAQQSEAAPVVPAPLSDTEDDDDGYETDYSDESDCSEASMVTLEQEGMITNTFESSYVGRQKLRKYHWYIDTLEYDRCSSRELKSFVVGRGLEDPYPAGITLKWFYIRVLEKADKALRPFRFQDLPPEMRNLVYTELLTLPECTCPKHCYCFAQILRTNRQIHDEAVSVLYGENEIEVSFAAFPVRRSRFEKYAQIHTVSHENLESAPFGSVPSGMSLFPDFLKRVNKLTISVALDFDLLEDYDIDTDRAVAWLGRCLLNLASFLMHDHRLKHLTIRFSSDDEELECEQAEACLYPLQRIRTVTDVKVMGTVSDETITELQSEIRDTTPAFNTLKTFLLLRDEAHAYLKLEYQLGSNSTADAMRGDNVRALHTHGTRTNIMRSLTAVIRRRLSSGIASRFAENAVLEDLAKLQEEIDVAGETEFFRRIRKLVSATETRSTYTDRLGGVENPRASRGSPEM
ncbi:hypothetical protein LTR36_005573 [Oleoguttula mirabilis]|uniref:Uncharacterized protein n=1 Tax=Oleoguttula mirabilis TaxID=1507867 RepID=A0AAV9JEW0_9PEZI|nr:hypothetical protein LTR36_005573 [Oleoguttula mirabilis]